MEKVVKNTQTDELFIETINIKDFKPRIEKWMNNHKQPCPLPSGHYIFRYPSDYNCEFIEWK